jgi:uncharacterized OB-fold protein
VRQTAVGRTDVTVSDEELLERYPWGAIDHDNKEQWRGFLDHRLFVDRCLECGHWFDPPRPMCPKCWSSRVEPSEVSGRGRVMWFTLMYQGFPGATPERPLPLAVVELEEESGLRVDAGIVECDPTEVRCDMPVELAWTGEPNAPIPAFRPRN